MTSPLFPTFADLAVADPYDVAAGAFPLVFRGDPKPLQANLQQLLRAWVGEKGSTFLGMNVGEPFPLEVAEHRIILVWERAMAACRVVEGSDHTASYLLLLDPPVMTLSHEQRVAHFRTGLPSLR